MRIRSSPLRGDGQGYQSEEVMLYPPDAATRLSLYQQEKRH
jgi:hypothetical protein